MICPQCQESLKDDARFCSNCGMSFSSFNTPTERAAHNLPETLLDIDPLVGQALDGRYELLARLGEGGMGVVYRARRVHIGDEVAVKVLLRKFVADSDLVKRFRREARAAAMLRHPNVVTIYDYGEAKGEDAPAYIVMELIEGISLGRLLQHEGRLAPARAVMLMCDVCAGVGAAHRRGVIHRDLKPDNVIVLPTGEDRERETVKVVDFGIAKLRDAAGAPKLTQAGTVIGSPSYMSPEQCRGETLDACSDVYSLGALLYKMLAGTPPFTAETSTGVLSKHLFDAPPPLSPSLGVAPAIEAVIMRALAKDPDARPADASAFARELQKAERRVSEEEERRRKDGEEATALALTAEERKRREDEERTRERGTAAKPVKASPTIRLPAKSYRKWIVAAAYAALVISLFGITALAWLWGSIRGAQSTPSQGNNKPLTTPQGKSFSENINGVTLEMVLVPGGTFDMGSPKSEEGRKDNEGPQHSVTVQSFYMGKFEVTQAQWRAVMGTNPPRLNGDDHPVGGLLWDDAVKFCEKLSQMTGKKYRLPTEAEWEYAARAGTTTPFAFGASLSSEQANCDVNYPYGITPKGVERTTTSVGSFQPNAFGLYDMHGNVQEWCADVWHENYDGAPTKGSPWLNGGDSSQRVKRGGWYSDNASDCRSASRAGFPPDIYDILSYNGFRVVVSART